MPGMETIGWFLVGTPGDDNDTAGAAGSCAKEAASDLGYPLSDNDDIDSEQGRGGT